MRPNGLHCLDRRKSEAVLKSSLFVLLAVMALLSSSTSKGAEPIIKQEQDVTVNKGVSQDRAQQSFDNWVRGRKVQGSTGPTAPPKPTQGNTTGFTAKGTLGGSTGPTKPPLPTAAGRHQ